MDFESTGHQRARGLTLVSSSLIEYTQQTFRTLRMNLGYLQIQQYQSVDLNLATLLGLKIGQGLKLNIRMYIPWTTKVAM